MHSKGYCSIKTDTTEHGKYFRYKSFLKISTVRYISKDQWSSMRLPFLIRYTWCFYLVSIFMKYLSPNHLMRYCSFIPQTWVLAILSPSWMHNLSQLVASAYYATCTRLRFTLARAKNFMYYFHILHYSCTAKYSITWEIPGMCQEFAMLFLHFYTAIV